MVLSHKFKIIEKDKDINFNDITSEHAISIDDSFIQYITDTLNWVESHWNYMSNDNRGINYYGVTFFEESGIKKLNNILINWKNMFDLAPENFQLKTEYDIEEMIFVKEDFAKEKVIIQLEKIINLCNEAENTNQILVHFGI